MGKIKDWSDERYLELGDFTPFYGPLYRRPDRLEKQGLPLEGFQSGKLKEGTKVLELYNYAVTFGAGVITCGTIIYLIV